MGGIDISSFFDDVMVPILCPSCKHENAYPLKQIEDLESVICKHCYTMIRLKDDIVVY